MTALSKTDRAWIINRLIDEADGALMAEADSAADKRLRKLAKSDVLTCYDAMFGMNYYAFTQTGRQLVVG